MWGIIYLLVAVVLGWAVFEPAFGGAVNRSLSCDLPGRGEIIPRWMVSWPMYFIVGTVLLTWGVYGMGCVFAADIQPLKAANRVVLAAAGMALALRLWRAKPWRSGMQMRSALKEQRVELIVVVGLAVIGTTMMWLTLRDRDGHYLVVGPSVWSDFGPHLSVIRSFSHGQNFPTQYPHFPDGHARYHFLFQFLAGNLEYLGLPLDWAFNLPSVLGFVACGMLLFSLAAALAGNRLVGVFAVVFFFFRSSFAWVDFVRAGSIQALLPRLLQNSEFIGRTEHEDWGLWNQNIYVNQRHLAFVLAVLWFALLLMHPHFRDMLRSIAQRRESEPKRGLLKIFLWEPDAWIPRRDSRFGFDAICIGLLLGLCGFWNGAVVIAALLLLFGMAVVSRHRLEYLALAVPALALAFAENRLFLGAHSIAVKPQFTLGFLAQPPKGYVQIVQYYLDLEGPLPWALLASLWALRRVRFGGFGIWACIFLLPLVMATTVQFTPDLAINHKYVMIAVMLINIIVATWIVSWWRTRSWWRRSIAIAAVFLLTATGVIDAITLYNRNAHDRGLVLDLDDPVIHWVEANTGRRDVFLTDWYSIHSILLAGRPIFYGWPYYAWGAGYDTHGREEIVKGIYGGTDPATVVRLVRENNIRYITIDSGNRQQKLYVLQEKLLRSLFPVAFVSGDLTILRTF